MFSSDVIMRDDRSDGRIRGPLKVLLLIFLAALLLALSSCGKKGALTLTSYETPPAPKLLNACHRANAITISWAFPEDKEDMTQDFVLLRASDGDFRRIAFPERGKRSYSDTGFDTGVRYRYKIVARNHRGMLGNESNILSATPVHLPPPPVNVSFIVKGNSLILSWQSEEKGICYNVYKGFKKGESTPSPVNVSPLTRNSFADAFDSGRIVYYSIRSVAQSDIINEGPPSAVIEVDPFSFVPSAPQGLRAFPAPDRVILYWDEAREPWVTGFRVYRRIGDAPYELIGRTQIPAFVDMMRSSTKRDYLVTAVGPGSEGPGAEVTGVLYRPQE
jgi:fibronectin type 3 domain-containing protein